MTTFATCACTDTDGVDANAHTIGGCVHVGGAWARQTGSTGAAVFTSNRLRTGTSNTRAIYYKNDTPGSANYSSFCDLVAVSNDNTCRVGPGVRLTSGSDNGYFMRYEGNLVGWQLFKRISGTQTNFQTVGAVLTVGQTYRAECRVSGSTLSMWVDGVQVGINTTDTDLSAAGFPGLYFIQATASGSTGYHVDNFAAIDDTAGTQDTPELYGRPYGVRGQTQMSQLLAQ